MKGYEILVASYENKEVDVTEKGKLMDKIKLLASTPNPQNRYELGQLIGFSVNSILDKRLNWLDNIADVRRGSVGDNPEFKVPYSGLVAKVGAKGGTPEVSMVFNKRVTIDTNDVSIRPKVDYSQLAQNPELIMRMIEESAIAIENAIVIDIQDKLYTTFSALSAPNYASGAGIVKATFDEQLRAIQRFGMVSVLGDITQIHGLTDLTGFSNRVADDLMIEHNNRRHLGTYLGASVTELENRYLDDSSLAETNLALRDDLIYGLYTGDANSRPLKVYYGGDLRVMERTNEEDESIEYFMRVTFGSLVVGNQKRMFIYEDTNE